MMIMMACIEAVETRGVVECNHCFCPRDLLVGSFSNILGLAKANSPESPESLHTPNYRSRGEIPKILKLAWGKAFVEVVAMWRLACV